MKRLLAGLLFILGMSIDAMAAGPVISSVAITGMTSSTATIQWTTDVASTSQIKYGNDATLPYATPVDHALGTSHSVTLILLQPGPMYYFAAVSTDAGGPTQSSTLQFSICGSPNVPVSGILNNYYQYGSFTATWIPPAGYSATPTVCGNTFPHTVTGTISMGGSIAFEVADASKVIPGPGTWQIQAQDVGNIAPFTVTNYITQSSQEITAQLQMAANASGLTPCMANTLTNVTSPSTCASGGGGGSPPFPPSYTVQLAAPGSPPASFLSDPNFTINPSLHTFNVGAAPTGPVWTISTLSAVPVDWTLDGTTPSTAFYSISGHLNGASYATPAAAVAAACATGLEVDWPSGVFPQSATMNACPNLHMYCAANDLIAGAGTRFVSQTGFPGYNFANPDADTLSPTTNKRNVRIDNCQFDISQDTVSPGAIYHKGISQAVYDHIGVFSNNNQVPAITADGSNFNNNGGDYDSTFRDIHLYDNSSNSYSTSIGILFKGQTAGQSTGGSNNIQVIGGGISRYGTSARIDFADNVSFRGVDLEDFNYHCIELAFWPTTVSTENHFDVDSRCEAGSIVGTNQWAASTAYATNAIIIDSNDNLEVATVGGTSGGTVPTWPAAVTSNSTPAPGTTTTDGSVTWTMRYHRTGIATGAGATGNNIGAYMAGAFRYTQDLSDGKNSIAPTTTTGDVGTTTAQGAATISNSPRDAVFGLNVPVPIVFPDINLSSSIGGEMIHGVLGVDREIGICGGNGTESFLDGGCPNYAVIKSNSNTAGTTQYVLPDTAGATAQFLVTGHNVDIAPVGTANIPSSNYISYQFVMQNSWYDGRLVFAQYNSGGTASGTGTCSMTGFNNSVTGANFTINVVAGVIAVQEGALVAGGTGGSQASPPTTATLSSGTATCSGTANVATLVGSGTGQFLLENAPGGGANPAQTLLWEPNGTTGLSQYFFEFGNNGGATAGANISLYNTVAATSILNQAPPAINLLGQCWNGTASANLYWTLTPDVNGNFTIAQTAGCSAGVLKIPSNTTISGPFLPSSAGGGSIGTSALPFGSVNFGHAANDSVALTCAACTTNRTAVFPDGNSQPVLVASLTTTAAASDNVTIQGMTSSGHCTFSATNAGAATDLATSYVSAKTTNQITVTHPANAGDAYDLLCTAN